MVCPGDRVAVPELLMVTDPPFVVTTFPLLTKLLPVTLIPPAPMAIFPLIVVVPVPPFSVAELATSPCIVRLFVCWIRKSSKVWVDPTFPEMVMLLVPAFSVISKGVVLKLSIVLKNWICCDAAAVLKLAALVRATGAVKRIPLFEVMVLPAWTEPAPVCEKAPSKVKLEPLGMLSRPLLAIETPPPDVVVTVLLKVKAVPVKLMPSTFEVETAPLNVVVPLPAV